MNKARTLNRDSLVVQKHKKREKRKNKKIFTLTTQAIIRTVKALFILIELKNTLKMLKFQKGVMNHNGVPKLLPEGKPHLN